MSLRNRIIKAATFEVRTPDALVTDALIDFHRQPARGGVGMTTVAYLAVSPEGRTHRQQIWLRQDAVPGLRRLTDAIHAEGAAVANAASNRLPALGPGTFLSPLGFRRTKAATRPTWTDRPRTRGRRTARHRVRLRRPRSPLWT